MPTPEKERTRFIVDAMLGSLVRKLRALGFNASYYRAGDDVGLLATAKREGRIVLTSDLALASGAGSKGVRAFLLKGRSDGARLREIVLSASRTNVPLVRGESLCSTCGEDLDHIGRKDVEGLVHPSVQQRHRVFFKCASCGQLYWKGSHWKKLRSLARRLP